MKIFLSHNTKDKDFVEKLATELKANDFECWLCEVDILLGDDFVDEIEKVQKESDFTLLIWFPDPAASPWTGKEWRSVLSREIKESRTRLGIVLLRDAEIPELLRTRHRIDARSDASEALHQTLQWLIRHRDMRRVEETGAIHYILDFNPEDSPKTLLAERITWKNYMRCLLKTGVNVCFTEVPVAVNRCLRSSLPGQYRERLMQLCFSIAVNEVTRKLV